MSGAEIILGTIACVAAVVSAYRDGGTIIQKIKVKRAEKRASPPSRLLEESIDSAPADIEREKQRGIQRFGKAFESGDTIAIIALQQITIQLQGTLLEELRNAAFDDAVTDFRYLVDVADAGRDKTMNTLIELRQRLMVAEPLGNDLSPTSPHGTTFPSKQRASLPLLTGSSPPPSKSELRPAQTWAQSNHAASRDASGEEDAASGAENAPKRNSKNHRSSLLGIFRHRTNSHGAGSGVNTPGLITECIHDSSRPASPPPRAHTIAHDARSSISASSSHSANTVSTAWNYQPWEDHQDDPAKIWGAHKAGTASSPPEQTSQDRPASSSPPISRPSLTPSWNRNNSVAIPAPTQENHYLGFCKNAVRLQNGDRSVFEKLAEHAYSRSGYSMNTVYYLACKSSKCSYMSQLKADTIWDRVWTDPELGIKWRWPFLAKSHVQQKQVKGQQYAYQCLFCTFANGKGAVYNGSRMYLKHVASHRGDISEVLKYKASCINDRVCEDDEEFDINLYPLDGSETREREPSQTLSDELMGLGLYPPKPEPADSVYGTNEPWNEGLSNFHYGGDIDRTELE